ncbi:MAG: YolD-like family protein [Bacilli bacterium]|jgi:hypothetical protein
MPSNERKGKWQPFDALEGFRDALVATERKKNKIPKPELLPDAAAEIDRALRMAVESRAEAGIAYYNDGEILKTTGVITKIDAISRSVRVGRRKIALDSIVDVSVNIDEREQC